MDQDAIKEQEEREREAQSLSKANEAIAIRPRRGKLTLLSRRIYNALLYHAQRQGVDEPTYRLSLTELIGDARFHSKNTELLKSHLRDMQTTTIEWSTSSATSNRWLSTQLIGTVSIEERGRGQPCFVSWSYPNEIRERLLKPNQYTKVLLEIGAQMRSYAAAVLYELGARYLTSPSRLTMREDVVWWASVLQGRSDITEVDYRFLRRDVISKALVEVDSLSDDFKLELIEHKQGRKVVELQFKVIKKDQQSLGGINEPNRNVFDLAIVGRLIAIGIKQSDAQDMYATTDEGLLRSALDLVEQRLKNHALPGLNSPAAYFRDALKKGYAISSPKTQDEVGEGGTKENAAKPQRLPKLSKDAQMERLRNAWDANQVSKARELFNEMSETQKAEVSAYFERDELHTLAAPIAKAWKRDGSASKIASSAFFRWLASETWKEEPSDDVLFNFALSNGVLKI